MLIKLINFKTTNQSNQISHFYKYALKLFNVLNKLLKKTKLN